MLKADQDSLPFIINGEFSQNFDSDKNSGVITPNLDTVNGGIDFRYGEPPNTDYPLTKFISFNTQLTSNREMDQTPKTIEFKFVKTSVNTQQVGVACFGFSFDIYAGNNVVFFGLCLDFTNNSAFIAKVTKSGSPSFANIYEEYERLEGVDVFANMRVTFEGTQVRADVNGQLVQHDFLDYGGTLEAFPSILGSGLESDLLGMTLNKWSVCDIDQAVDFMGFEVEDCNHIPFIEPPFIDQPLLGSVSVEPFGYLSQAPLLLTNNTQEVRLAGLAGSTSKEAIADASVSLTLVLEQNNNTIIDSVPMSYDEGSQSYRALLDGSLLVRGLIYTLTVKAVIGSSVGEWHQTLKAQDRLLEVVGSGAKLY